MKPPTSECVADFYDKFSQKLIKDFVYGNERVEAQKQFFYSLISPSISSILVIGCGLGDVAASLARKCKRHGTVLGVDISTENVRIARRLFQAPNLTFECMDIVEGQLNGNWDLVLFPDVYEHIPSDLRPRLHKSLNELLSPEGVVALACPTVEHQEQLRKSGEGLQIVDEDVHPEDVIALAADVGGLLTYYSLVEVWGRPSYFHAVVERIPQCAGTFRKSREISFGLPFVRELERKIAVRRRRRFVCSKGLDFPGDCH